REVPHPVFTVWPSLGKVLRRKSHRLKLQTASLIDVIVDGDDAPYAEPFLYILDQGLAFHSEQVGQLRPAARRLIHRQSRRGIGNESDALLGFLVLCGLSQRGDQGLDVEGRQASTKQAADQGTIAVVAPMSLAQVLPRAGEDSNRRGDLLGG